MHSRIKNRQSMTACSLLRLCYDGEVNCLGAETTTLEVTHKLKISATTLCDERNKYILAPSFTFTPHRQKSTTLRISSPLIVSCISYYTPEQYTIKIFNIAAITILIYFSHQLNLHSTPGLALSIEISCSPNDS